MYPQRGGHRGAEPRVTDEKLRPREPKEPTLGHTELQYQWKDRTEAAGRRRPRPAHALRDRGGPCGWLFQGGRGLSPGLLPAAPRDRLPCWFECGKEQHQAPDGGPGPLGELAPARRGSPGEYGDSR